MTRRRGQPARVAESGGYSSMSLTEVARALGIHRTTVNSWVARGCPRNGDETLSLPLVFHWALMEQKERKPTNDVSGEQAQKLRNQNRILEAKIAEMEGKYLPTSEVFQIGEAQARALTQFWSQGWRRALPELLKALKVPATRGPEVIAVIMGYVRQGMEAFSAAGKEIGAGEIWERYRASQRTGIEGELNK